MGEGGREGRRREGGRGVMWRRKEGEEEEGEVKELEVVL